MTKLTKCYVSTTDEFMSGWGGAEGKINKLVFTCNSKEQAEIVAENAKHQGQKDIKIHNVRPQNFFSEGRYLTQKKTIQDYPSWYKEGFFQPEPEPEVLYPDLREELNLEHDFVSTVNVPKTVQKYFNNIKIELFHNGTLSSHGVSLTALRSVLTSAIHSATYGYKEEYPYYREGQMFKYLDYMTLGVHGDIITVDLHSTKLNYTVQMIVEDKSNGYKRGDIVG